MTNINDPISVHKSPLVDGQTTITISVNVNAMPPNLLDFENEMSKTLNTVGCMIYRDTIKWFDVDEPQLVMPDGMTYYSCGLFPQTYETPNGQVSVERHMYQTSKGGRKYCPLEDRARMVLNSTPKYAQMITSKAAHLAAPAVQQDLHDNHNRDISARYVKTLVDEVGGMARYGEEHWKYDIPGDINEEDVKTLSMGIDGTCMFLATGEGWREAMVGTISLYDHEGQRLHTIRLGAAPQYGKQEFYSLMEREWDITRQKFPNAVTQGLADGAASNWKWLNDKTDIQLLDFWHLSEYITKAATALYGPKKQSQIDEFTSYWCSYIKHHTYGVNKLIVELEDVMSSKNAVKDRESLRTVIEYLKNQASRTHYARELAANRPIGSGVSEATCKTLIKSRMCQSGMRWKIAGASNVIAIRSLVITDTRWGQFWGKIMCVGPHTIMRKIHPKK